MRGELLNPDSKVVACCLTKPCQWRGCRDPELPGR